MADTLPFFAAETGTYSTTGPTVSLSGTAASLGTYPTRTFAAADADATTTFASTNTCTVVIVKDANNYKRYTGAVWTSGSPSTIGLSTATLEGSAGMLSDSDAVTVFGSLPTITPAAIGAAAASHTHTQSESHGSPDTDTAATALHHTLGTGANQAAAGDHGHGDVKTISVVTVANIPAAGDQVAGVLYIGY